MKTINSSEIIAKHDTELDYTPYGYDKTIREMLTADPEAEWQIIETADAPNGAECPSYVASKLKYTDGGGYFSPVVLSIYDAVEPGWETEKDAEKTLITMGILETLVASWE